MKSWSRWRSTPGQRVISFVICIVVAFTLGVWSRPWLSRWLIGEPEVKAFEWPNAFSVVSIPSSIDGSLQEAYFLRAAEGQKMPLLVSLHVWAGTYASPDALAAHAQRQGWNYIRPNFRGPNLSPENCLSRGVIADIDDAITYAIESGNVDRNNIFVVGFSGGGYATLGAYLSSRHQIKLWQAWAPISSLEAWYWELVARGHQSLARSILGCTGSGNQLDTEEARRRSPLFWDLSGASKGRLEIYAGIKDGYSGTVPISHAINFYNAIVESNGQVEHSVSSETASALLTRAQPAESSAIEGRRIYFHADAGRAALTVFDGGHELLADFAFDRVLELWKGRVISREN